MEEEWEEGGEGEKQRAREGVSVRESALEEMKWGLACPRAQQGCMGWLQPWSRKRWLMLYERLQLRSIESEVAQQVCVCSVAALPARCRLRFKQVASVRSVDGYATWSLRCAAGNVTD